MAQGNFGANQQTGQQAGAGRCLATVRWFLGNITS